MTLADYLFYAVIGLCVVFVGLVLVMIFIKLIMAIPEGTPKTAGGAKTGGAGAGSIGGAGTSGGAGASAGTAADAGAGAASGAPLAPGTAGDVKLYDTDPRDAAMIMAIVADQLQKPLNELRFISIKEVK